MPWSYWPADQETCLTDWIRLHERWEAMGSANPKRATSHLNQHTLKQDDYTQRRHQPAGRNFWVNPSFNDSLSLIPQRRKWFANYENGRVKWQPSWILVLMKCNHGLSTAPSIFVYVTTPNFCLPGSTRATQSYLQTYLLICCISSLVLKPPG